MAVLKRPVAGGARAGGARRVLKARGRPAAGPPASWRADFPIIKRLRRRRDAPVDTIGCERLADPKACRADFEWQTLVAAMLSSQTKDQANAEAMAELRRFGNTAANVAAAPVARLARLIRKVGFHRTKAKHLKAAARLCQQEHGGRIPQTLEGLLELPGVGPKMAHLTLAAAFDRFEGLCIDTHIHRIANALGWLRPRTKTPEQTRIALEAWLPRREWRDFNILMVGLGQMQQQAPEKLVDRCLAGPQPAPALRLLTRIGFRHRPGRFASLDAAAARRPEIRRVLARRT